MELMEMKGIDQVQRKSTPFKYKHVMLVDDNDLDNFINEKIIESAKFCRNVYISTSSKSALEFLNNVETMGSISSEIYPDLIFIDLNMPIIDGFQFIECLLQMKNDNISRCKLVILTSSVNPEDRKKAESISADITFLHKPLTLSVLDKL